MVLPRLGGTPAVWNTCMVFFQAALLAGYAYAHLTERWARQPVLHVLLLLLPWLVLPISIPESWSPPGEENPMASILGLLLRRVGLPFFVLATSGSVLQSWFARSGEKDPYFLYAASNVGSLLGLLGYPVLLEPFLPLARQSSLWAWAFVAFSVLTAACAKAALAHAPLRSEAAAEAAPLSFKRKLRWVALAAIPSAQMLGVTTYVTTDIAAAPLLWVVPLAIYLWSFILVFARGGLRTRSAWIAIMPFAVLSLAALLVLGARDPVKLTLPVHLAAFFVVCMVLHGELAHDRPEASHLTAYYLLIAVGGLVGGTLTALVAPLVFKDVTEYPLALVLACALAPSRSEKGNRARDVTLPAALGAFTFLMIFVSQDRSPEVKRILIAGLPIFFAFTFSRRPIRFALGVGAILVATSIGKTLSSDIIHAERSFFGIHRVNHDVATIESGGASAVHSATTVRFRTLSHGTTRHGRQREDEKREPSDPREPLMYYSRPGPIGQAVTALIGKAPGKHVGVVGLGAGSLAAYAEPGQSLTYFEIDPAVERIAEEYFTYLGAARARGAAVKIVLGDARLTLARSDERFDLLAIDAFSSDAIPLHLLTREAIARAYLPRLAPHAAVFFHVSNRYLDLVPILGDLAGDGSLVCFSRHDSVDEEAGNLGYTSSIWVALARAPEDLGPLARDPRWTRIPPRERPTVWTDDESNILSALAR